MKELLIKLNACNEAKEWAGDKTWPEIYSTCHRGDWLLWLWFKTMYHDNDAHFRLLILTKGHCANVIRHLMTDEKSIAAVDAAIAFGEGKITKEELKKAAAYAYAYAVDAADAAYAAAAYAYAYADAAAYAAADAAYAAAERTKNQQKTADICRKYLPIELWNISY